MPYDPKWALTINGEKQPYFKANKSFMAFKVYPGDQRIVLQYLPGSWLRFAIPLAFLLTFGSFVYIIWNCFKESKSYDRNEKDSGF